MTKLNLNYSNLTALPWHGEKHPAFPSLLLMTKGDVTCLITPKKEKARENEKHESLSNNRPSTFSVVNFI